MCVTVKVYYSFFSSNSAYFKTENVSKAKTQWKKLQKKQTMKRAWKIF